MTPRKIKDTQNYMKLHPKAFDFCEILKCGKKYSKTPFFIYCTKRKCSQKEQQLKNKNIMGAKRPKSLQYYNKHPFQMFKFQRDCHTRICLKGADLFGVPSSLCLIESVCVLYIKCVMYRAQNQI